MSASKQFRIFSLIDARVRCVAAVFAATTLAFAGTAFALKSDKQQTMYTDADRSQTVTSKTNATNDPDVTDYDGNVITTQGSIKITGAHSTVYRIPPSASDPNAGQVNRVVVTGKQAHMQEVHDGDCALMTANANKIDYNPITDIAILTGGVVVVQSGRGEFHGENMIYNTNTGDMESGDKTSSAGRVHTVMEPKTDKPPPSPNNCGFALGSPKPTTKPAAPTKPVAPTKPAASKRANASKGDGTN